MGAIGSIDEIQCEWQERANIPPIDPPVAARPVASPRLFEKKWATHPMAGVNIRELAIPQRIE